MTSSNEKVDFFSRNLNAQKSHVNEVLEIVKMTKLKIPYLSLKCTWGGREGGLTCHQFRNMSIALLRIGLFQENLSG